MATPLTLLAVTPAPTKLIVLALDTTFEPSSFTITPLIPELAMVIVATPLTLLAVTPAPTKLMVLAPLDRTFEPSSCMMIVEEPAPAAVYWNVPSANLIPTWLFAGCVAMYCQLGLIVILPPMPRSPQLVTSMSLCQLGSVPVLGLKSAYPLLTLIPNTVAGIFSFDVLYAAASNNVAALVIQASLVITVAC